MKFTLNQIPGFKKAWATIQPFYQKLLSKAEEKGPSRTILILLPSSKEILEKTETPILASWLILDSEGLPLTTSIDAKLSELTTSPEESIWVVVPATEILLSELQLPFLRPSRLQQALPYALEEQVLEDIDLLHFAASRYFDPAPSEQNKLAVAAVKKEALSAWLDQLQKYNIQPDLLCSEVDALPYHDNQWTLLLTAQIATVRTGLYSGFGTESSALETLLALKLAETTLKPEKLVIYHESKIKPTFPLTPLNV